MEQDVSAGMGVGNRQEASAGISGKEIERAAQILQEVINSDRPSEVVFAHLQEIHDLLPAFIELNARHALEEGCPHIGGALRGILQEVGYRPLEGTPSAPRDSQTMPAAEDEERLSDLRVGLLPDPHSGFMSRQTLAAEAIRRVGCTLEVIADPSGVGPTDFDLVLAHNPHADQACMRMLAEFSAANVPILVDLDRDFQSMPLSDESYETYGLGTLERARAFTAVTLLADAFTVPGETMMDVLRPAKKSIHRIPEMWDSSYRPWQKPVPDHSTLNLGWIPGIGGLEDLASVRRILIRVAREYPQVQIVIVGDVKAYGLFAHLPASRRLFLPWVKEDDYAYLLAQIDVLLVPLRKVPFNHSLSDRRLLEAGIRSIPWIASPTPAHRAWGRGGLFARTQEDWYRAFKRLITDPLIRVSMADKGREKAQTRELRNMSGLWRELLLQYTKCNVASKVEWQPDRNSLQVEWQTA